MATEGATGAAPTASEYIVHHLGHANTSGKPQQAIIDFTIINLDTVFWSIVTGLLSAWLLHRAARMITSGVPNRYVGAVEAVLEFVHEQARSIVHGNVSYIAPLPWRHTATLFAAHVASEADLPAPFNLSGETWQIAAPVDDDRIWRFYPSYDGQFVTAYPEPPVGTTGVDESAYWIAPLKPGAGWVPFDGNDGEVSMLIPGTPAP